MKLYTYEHCPFCVITKMIFALKKHPVEIEYLLYNDINTPMQMVGRKMLPVLEYKPHHFMAESMDIIQYVDLNIGEPRITLPLASSITEWVNGVQRFIYRLTFPRWIKAPFPEFSTEQAVDYFVQGKDPSGRGFMSDLADPLLKQRAQTALDNLEKILIKYPLLDKERPLSMSDFYLFAQLHSLSIVEGLDYGEYVAKWRITASEVCSVSLHDEFAC